MQLFSSEAEIFSFTYKIILPFETLNRWSSENREQFSTVLGVKIPSFKHFPYCGPFKVKLKLVEKTKKGIQLSKVHNRSQTISAEIEMRTLFSGFPLSIFIGYFDNK